MSTYSQSSTSPVLLGREEVTPWLGEHPKGKVIERVEYIGIDAERAENASEYTVMIEEYLRKEKRGLRLQLDPVYYGVLAKRMADRLILEQHCPVETARQLSHLVLYDVVMLLDDSTSMRIKEDGTRIETLVNVLRHICSIYDLANPNGLTSVRFLNGMQGIRNFTANKVDRLREHRWNGVTKIGTELKQKIIDPFVSSAKEMNKPLLVMVITDGEVEGERPGILENVIKKCISHVEEDPGKGEYSIAFHFSCVGEDEDARELLQRLDNDYMIGKYVDCLMNHRLEDIDEAKWEILPKLLLGGIMEYYDNDDRKSDDEYDEWAPTIVYDED